MIDYEAITLGGILDTSPEVLLAIANYTEIPIDNKLIKASYGLGEVDETLEPFYSCWYDPSMTEFKNITSNAVKIAEDTAPKKVIKLHWRNTVIEAYRDRPADETNLERIN